MNEGDTSLQDWNIYDYDGSGNSYRVFYPGSAAPEASRMRNSHLRFADVVPERHGERER